MKILFELPQRERNKVKDILAESEILYCTPYDLSGEGKYTDGWFVITKDIYIILENGQIKEKLKISDGSEYKLVNSVGAGCLEAEFQGVEKIIARFSMTHVPRYTYIAKILDMLSKGEIPKVISDEVENTCPKCGRMFIRGTKICRNCTNKKVVLNRFFLLIKPYRLLFVASILIFSALTALSLVSPAILRHLIDEYLTKQRADARAILLLILTIGACDLVRTLLDVVKNRLMTRVGTGISRDLRKTVFAKI
jgi:ATP-binding cassette, subfamily B, bacterial